MNSDVINQVFAWAPMTAFVVVVAVVYAAKRNEAATAPSHGKTYACAQCGRRGNREHMVPVTHEGAVVWYCERCSGRPAH